MRMRSVLKNVDKGYHCSRCGLFADWSHKGSQLCDLCYAATQTLKTKKEKKVDNLEKWL